MNVFDEIFQNLLSTFHIFISTHGCQNKIFAHTLLTQNDKKTMCWKCEIERHALIPCSLIDYYLGTLFALLPIRRLQNSISKKVSDSR